MSADAPWRIAPILGVRDVASAVDHYTKVLGFDCPGGIFEGVVPGEGGVYAVVRRAGSEIHLQIRRREVFAGPRQPFESDAYVFVPDADAVFRELSARGAQVAREPEDAPYALRDFAVEDPDGHRIVFGSPLA